MTEEKTGEVQAQAAAEPATGVDTGAPAAEVQPAVPAARQEEAGKVESARRDLAESGHTVPVSVLRGVRDELKNTKDELSLYKAQLEEARRQPSWAAPGKPDAPPAGDPFAGRRDDELVTLGEIKSVVGRAFGMMGDEIRQLRFAASGAEQTVTDHLVPILERNPDLRDAFLSRDVPRITVEVAKYLAGNKGEAASQPAQIKESALAAIEKILENAAKPGSASALSGAAPMSRADRFSHMSDDELEMEIKKAKGG